MACWRKSAVWAMFFPVKERKPYQGTLGSLEVILIGSRIRPGPSMDPAGTLKLVIVDLYQGPEDPPRPSWTPKWTPKWILRGKFCTTLGKKKGPPWPLHGPK